MFFRLCASKCQVFLLLRRFLKTFCYSLSYNKKYENIGMKWIKMRQFYLTDVNTVSEISKK